MKTRFDASSVHASNLLYRHKTADLNARKCFFSEMSLVRVTTLLRKQSVKNLAAEFEIKAASKFFVLTKSEFYSDISIKSVNLT